MPSLKKILFDGACLLKAYSCAWRDSICCLLQILYTDDLCAGEQVFFAATGVSDGDLLRGVRYFAGGASSNSIVMRSGSGTGILTPCSTRPKTEAYDFLPPLPLRPLRHSCPSSHMLASGKGKLGLNYELLLHHAQRRCLFFLFFPVYYIVVYNALSGCHVPISCCELQEPAQYK